MSRIGKITRRAFLVGSVAIAGGVAFGYYLYTAPPTITHTQSPLASVEIGATGEEYIQDCGAELVVQNSVRAKDNYKQK